MTKKFTAGLSFATLIFFVTNTLNAEEEIQRRVLVIPFDNMQGNKNYDWMSESIADNLKSELLKSGRFLVMDVALLRKINPNMEFANLTADEAAGFAQKLNCEAAIIGRFFIRSKNGKENALLQTEGVDAITKKSVLIKSEYANMDGAIFNSVQALASDIAREFGEKLSTITEDEAHRDAELEKRIARLEGRALPEKTNTAKAAAVKTSRRIIGRWWATAGYPYMKSLPLLGDSNPSTMVVGAPLPLDAMRGYAMLEGGIAPGRWQVLPAKIQWAVAAQFFYGQGNFPEATGQTPTVSLLSMGGGLRIDRPFLIAGKYSLSPVLGFNVHYQRYFRSFSSAYLSTMALVPEVGLNQYFRLGTASKWQLMLSTIVGGFFYNNQNLSYVRISLGVEYAYR